MTTEPRSADPEVHIRAVIEERAKAIRAKNAADVVRHHAPDFVQFSLAPPLISTAADAEGWNAWFATWRGGLGYEIHRLHVTAAGEVAFTRSLNRLSGTTVDGETEDIWFRQTLGFHKVAGEWKIVHEHESVPFYMDGSLKAAVDLQP